MPMFDEKHVKICGGIIVWDGITQPEKTKFSDGTEGLKYEMSIGVENHNPDIPLVDQLARNALQESKWKGNFPAGGHWPVKAATPSMVSAGVGHLTVIKCSTYYTPEVYDENGQRLDPMQYGPQIFTGQRVDVLISCKAYDNVSKGIKAQLDGFQIIASAGAQRITIGGDGAAAGAFGGGGQAAQPAGGAAPGFQSPQQQPQPGYGAQQGAPNSPPAQGYGASQGGAPQHQQNPQGGAPGGYGQPAQNQPAQNAAPQGYGAPNGSAGGAPAQGYGAPSQAHNFLPGQGQ